MLSVLSRTWPNTLTVSPPPRPVQRGDVGAVHVARPIPVLHVRRVQRSRTGGDVARPRDQRPIAFAQFARHHRTVVQSSGPDVHVKSIVEQIRAPVGKHQ